MCAANRVGVADRSNHVGERQANLSNAETV